VLLRDHGDGISAEDWKPIDRERYGVWVALGRPTGGVGERVPERIWEGWNGDRFLTARCNEQGEFVWLTTWDSEADAAEFANGYRVIAESVRERAGLDGISVDQLGRDVVVYTDGLEVVGPLATFFARRARVSTLQDLLVHLPLPSASAGESAAR